jgi:hypothetical protein
MSEQLFFLNFKMDIYFKIENKMAKQKFGLFQVYKSLNRGRLEKSKGILWHSIKKILKVSEIPPKVPCSDQGFLTES